MNMPACSLKQCSEGRKACPCPAACELPEESRAVKDKLESRLLLALAVLALIAALSPAFFL